MRYVFPEPAIELLRASRFDPAATPDYELISGGVMWSDEDYTEFMWACRAGGCSDYGRVFAYRTSLLCRDPYEPYRFAWDEVRERCPEWIGFRPERTTGSRGWARWVRRMQRDF